MGKAIRITIDSVFGFLGITHYFRRLSKPELMASVKLRRARINASSQFENGRVIERMPNTPFQQSIMGLLWTFFFRRHHLAPQHPIHYKDVDVDRLRIRSEALRVTWLGHSSLFIEMNHTRLLVDPVFGHASPLMTKPIFDRNVAAPVSRENLPVPDIIVISHDHYDHLEKSTVKFYANTSVHFFVPLGVGRHLENWGVDPHLIKEFDWWESTVLNGISITAAPANHNSGRTGTDKNTTLWCSWAIQSINGSVFYSGDTAYDRHFKEIKNRLGHFDIAFIEVAANVKNGVGFPVENWGHMQARHTIQAFQDLEADTLCAVHWSTFELFTHRWDEPMDDLISEASHVGASVMTPMIGESMDLSNAHNTFYRWWKDDPVGEETKKYYLTKSRTIVTEKN